MAEDRRAQGRAMRRKLMGDAYADKLDNGLYKHPIMEKFAAYTQEAVFGALWTRPGLDLKTRALICVISDAAQGRDPRVETASAVRSEPRVDRGRIVRSAVAPGGLRRRTAGKGSPADSGRDIQGNGGRVSGVTGRGVPERAPRVHVPLRLARRHPTSPSPKCRRNLPPGLTDAAGGDRYAGGACHQHVAALQQSHRRGRLQARADAGEMRARFPQPRIAAVLQSRAR